MNTTPLNVKLTLVLWILLTLASFNLLPWIIITLYIVLSFSRWAFDIHARLHKVSKENIVTRVENLMLYFITPLSVNMTQQRDTHLAHHKNLNTDTDKDPDSLFYTAPLPLSVLYSLFHPEIIFFRSIDTFSIYDWFTAFLKMTIFGLLLSNQFFWYYFLPVRLIFGFSQFVFTWVLHHDEKVKTVNIDLPRWLSFLIGTVGMKEFKTHIHHHKLI